MYACIKTTIARMLRIVYGMKSLTLVLHYQNIHSYWTNTIKYAWPVEIWWEERLIVTCMLASYYGSQLQLSRKHFLSTQKPMERREHLPEFAITKCNLNQLQSMVSHMSGFISWNGSTCIYTLTDVAVIPPRTPLWVGDTIIMAVFSSFLLGSNGSKLPFQQSAHPVRHI